MYKVGEIVLYSESGHAQAAIITAAQGDSTVHLLLFTPVGTRLCFEVPVNDPGLSHIDPPEVIRDQELLDRVQKLEAKMSQLPKR